MLNFFPRAIWECYLRMVSWILRKMKERFGIFRKALTIWDVILRWYSSQILITTVLYIALSCWVQEAILEHLFIIIICCFSLPSLPPSTALFISSPYLLYYFLTSIGWGYSGIGYTSLAYIAPIHTWFYLHSKWVGHTQLFPPNQESS